MKAFKETQPIEVVLQDPGKGLRVCFFLNKP